MVVLAKGELEQITLPTVHAPPLAAVAEIDLSTAATGAAGRAAAARAVARACEEHGFFKVTGHGVPARLLARLDAAAAAFFALPQHEKEKDSRLGYGSKRIGGNGDLGWVEYLLLGVTAAGAAAPVALAGTPLSVGESESPSCSFRELLNEYATAVRKMTCTILELIAEGLGLDDTHAFARLIEASDSDSMLRVNHYPPRPEPGQVTTGFGEHTDPQIVSVLRSNATSGLEISLQDGTWAAVPADAGSFFVNAGDALQALTNGRVRSVRHRVMVSSARPRVSVVFFAGPPLKERLAPMQGLVDREGGRRRYRDFTWREYKTSAFRTKLADDRLGYFETAAATS